MNDSSSRDPKTIILGDHGDHGPTQCPKCDSIELYGDHKGYKCIECGFKWKTADEYMKEWIKHHEIPEEEQPEDHADSADSDGVDSKK
jgi:uncharacterized Zn ribbon protein